MPRRVPLPERLQSRPFTIAEANLDRIGRDRLMGRDLARPFYGVRAARAPTTLLEACEAYVATMLDGHFFSHVTAARIWGVPLPREYDIGEDLHVACRNAVARARGRGVRGHRLVDEEVHVVERAGLPVTDPQSTWLHLAVILGERDLVAAGDHLVRSPPVSGTTPLATINALVERARGYHGRGAVRARAAASRLREGAESRPESLLRLLLVNAGLPEPELQVSITDSAGRFLARADMAYPDWRVIVEYDVDQHRTSTEQYEKDVSRIESLTFAGWSVVRVRALGLRDPSTTHRRVAAALRRAGYAPPSGHRHA